MLRHQYKSGIETRLIEMKKSLDSRVSRVLSTSIPYIHLQYQVFISFKADDCTCRSVTVQKRGSWSHLWK